MQLLYEQIAGLPRLAWLARVDKDSGRVRILHGKDVEISNTFYVEGVWNGDFAAASFPRSDAFFGSGASIDGEDVVFVSACDTLDSLYFREVCAHVYVSNSLPCLLAALDDELDATFERYHLALESVLNGIFDYETDVVSRKGGVKRVVFRNIRVGRDGIRFEDKPMPPHFAQYDDYMGYLVSSYAGLVQNIRDAKRNSAVDLFSTQSQGYDTTAVNAIASAHGLEKVFTCTTSRDKNAFVGWERDKRQQSDDGSLIGRVLGFPCIPIDRLSFRRFFPEEELYYAGHYDAVDVNLREINDHVVNVAVLLTGVRGEIWYGEEFYRGKQFRSDSLMKFDMAGHGLAELRLHVGLILLPFPFLGARRQEEIHAITRSAEMNRWRLGTAYDRPIARRIAEERGVPRQLFGQAKLNTSVAFPKPAVPITPALRAAFLDFLVESHRLAAWGVPLVPLIHRLNQAIYYHNPKRYRMLYWLERSIARTTEREFALPLLCESLSSALYCYAVNRTTARYVAWIRGAKQSESRREEAVT